MLTRVAAKQAKTTKVKNKFVNGKKSSKEHSVVFLVEENVKFRRKKLGDKVQAKSSNLPRQFCSNSVGTPLEFAAVLTPNIAELVLFGFFCPQPWYYDVSNTFCQENTSIFMLIGSLSRRKK